MDTILFDTNGTDPNTVSISTTFLVTTDYVGTYPLAPFYQYNIYVNGDLIDNNQSSFFITEGDIIQFELLTAPQYSQRRQVILVGAQTLQITFKNIPNPMSYLDFGTSDPGTQPTTWYTSIVQVIAGLLTPEETTILYSDDVTRLKLIVNDGEPADFVTVKNDDEVKLYYRGAPLGFEATDVDYFIKASNTDESDSLGKITVKGSALAGQNLDRITDIKNYVDIVALKTNTERVRSQTVLTAGLRDQSGVSAHAVTPLNTTDSTKQAITLDEVAVMHAVTILMDAYSPIRSERTTGKQSLTGILGLPTTFRSVALDAKKGPTVNLNSNGVLFGRNVISRKYSQDTNWNILGQSPTRLQPVLFDRLVVNQFLGADQSWDRLLHGKLHTIDHDFDVNTNISINPVPQEFTEATNANNLTLDATIDEYDVGGIQTINDTFDSIGIAGDHIIDDGFGVIRPNNLFNIKPDIGSGSTIKTQGTDSVFVLHEDGILHAKDAAFDRNTTKVSQATNHTYDLNARNTRYLEIMEYGLSVDNPGQASEVTVSPITQRGNGIKIDGKVPNKLAGSTRALIAPTPTIAPEHRVAVGTQTAFIRQAKALGSSTSYTLVREPTSQVELLDSQDGFGTEAEAKAYAESLGFQVGQYQLFTYLGKFGFTTTPEFAAGVCGLPIDPDLPKLQKIIFWTVT